MLDPHVQAVGIDPGSLCCEIDPLTFFIDNFFFYTQSILPSVCGVQQRHTFCLSFSSIFFLFSHSLFSPLLNRSSVNIARFSRPYAWEPVCYTNDELSTNASLHSPHVSPSPHSFCLSSALASMWPHYSHPKAQGSIYTCLCNTEKCQFKTQKHLLFLFFCLFFFPFFLLWKNVTTKVTLWSIGTFLDLFTDHHSLFRTKSTPEYWFSVLCVNCY